MMQKIYTLLERCSGTRSSKLIASYMNELDDVKLQELAVAHIMYLDVARVRKSSYRMSRNVSFVLLDMRGPATKPVVEYTDWNEWIDWMIASSYNIRRYAQTLEPSMRRLFAIGIGGRAPYHIGEALIRKHWPLVDLARMTRQFYPVADFAHPTLGDLPGNLEEWCVQEKLDGHRELLVIGKYTFMVSRSGNITMYPDGWEEHGILSCTRPATTEELREIRSGTNIFHTIIDGELVAYENDVRLNATSVPSIGVDAEIEARYHMFDCLMIDGQNIQSLPLRTRLAHLDTLHAKYPKLTMVDTFKGEKYHMYVGPSYEGYVLKKYNETYEEATWIKRKNCIENMDVMAWGYKTGSGTRAIGSVMIAGMSYGKLVQLGATAGISVNDESQFDIIPNTEPKDRSYTGLLKPCMIEIRCNGIQDGKPRHPALVRFRPDLPLFKYKK